VKTNIYENFDNRQVAKVKTRVEDNSKLLDKVVNEIIQPYCRDLDKYIEFIKSILQDGNNPPTVDELEDFCLNLSTYIYFAGGMCEQLGIRDDVAKAVYKEMYNTKRNDINGGTVADKDSIAELESQQEQLTSICFTRAYKTMKSKVENAQELLSSVKKVLSRRLAEIELTKIGGR
jgi:hypothetical protein